MVERASSPVVVWVRLEVPILMTTVSDEFIVPVSRMGFTASILPLNQFFSAQIAKLEFI
jgi:hypothetical protein